MPTVTEDLNTGSKLELIVDRSSPVPLYFQVAQQIEKAIIDRRLEPGDRLDTEVEIAERFGLSRPTVRQAIQELVQLGLLVRRRGVGTQITSGHVRRPVELSSLYSDLARANKSPSTEVLSLETVHADATVAAALGLGTEDPVVFLERLRSADEQPLAIMRNWLPASVAKLDRMELERNGLYELLQRRGVRIRVANQTIGAQIASARQARLLRVRSGTALLTMKRTAYDDSGRAIEYGDHVYRADRYSFETTLIAR